MEKELHNQILKSCPFGYAYLKIILNGAQEPSGYEFLEVNHAFEKISGLKAVDIIHHRVPEQIPEIINADYDLLKLFADVALNGAKYEIEQSLIKSPHKLYKLNIWSPEKFYFAVTFNEVTASSKTMYDNERRFRAIFELPLVGSAITAPDGKWLQVNDKFCETVGYTQEELQHLTWKDITPSEELEGELEFYRLVLSGKKVENPIKKRYLQRNGNVVDVFVYTLPVLNDEGKPDCFVSLIQDASEINLVEENIKKTDILLQTVSNAGLALLEESPFDNNVNKCLSLIGKVTQQDRVYVFQFHSEEGNGELLMSQRYEWVKSGISEQIDNPELQNISANTIALRWMKCFQNGEIITGNVVDFPDSERRILQAQDIISILVVPIKIDNNLWGFVGFDNCHSDAAWSEAEISILTSISSAIGIAISKQQHKAELLKITNLLEEREKYFRYVVDNSSDAHIIIDVSGKLVFASQAIEKITGYSASELYGRSISDVVHPDNIEETMRAFNETLQNPDRSTTIEFKHIHKTRTWVDIEAIGVNLISEPVINGILISARDITEQIKANNEVINSEQKYRQLNDLFRSMADNMPDMLWAKDLENKYLFANRAMCSKLLNAVDTDEPIGKNDMFFALRERQSHPENEKWHTFGEICRDSDTVVVKSGEIGHFEEYGNVKGKFLYLDVIKSPIRDESGKIIGTVGAGRDITERKQIEEIKKIQHRIANAVVETNSLDEVLGIVHAQINTLIDASNFFIALHDKASGMLTDIFGSDEADSFKTWPAEKSLTGLVIEKNKSILLNDFEMEELANNKVIQYVGRKSKSWLGVPLRIDGNVFGAFVVQSYNNSSAYNEHDKEMLEFISHHISIAIQRKKYEQELKDTLLMAQESDRLKSAFLMNMSHEIRTPMNGILGFAQLLKNPEFVGENQDEFIDMIEKSGQRMLNLISDLFDISKIEAGQVKISLSEENISLITRDLYSFFCPEAEGKGIKFELSPEKGNQDIIIVTDKDKFISILSNLIKNALKFTDKGSIEVGYTLTENHVLFYVRDTGRGIPVDKQKMVFDRFAQVDIRQNRGYEGAGLGLAISKAYVEMLGGRISVESEEGKGSKFNFILPIRPYENIEPEVVPVIIKKDTQDISSLTINVLVADDDAVSTQVLETWLKRIASNIYFAKNGVEAIDIITKHPEINLILMDIWMPEINGFEATRRIREFNNDVIIIAQTANALLGDREQAIASGCNDYISKPILIDKLEKMITNYIRK